MEYASIHKSLPEKFADSRRGTCANHSSLDTGINKKKQANFLNE
jgi:hypothetical protein